VPVARTLHRVVAHAVQREAPARRLAAHRVQRRRPPLIAHRQRAAARLDRELQLHAAALLLKLHVVVAVAGARQQRAVLVVACVATEGGQDSEDWCRLPVYNSISATLQSAQLHGTHHIATIAYTRLRCVVPHLTCASILGAVFTGLQPCQLACKSTPKFGRAPSGTLQDAARL